MIFLLENQIQSNYFIFPVDYRYAFLVGALEDVDINQPSILLKKD
jgi:hypothetical protein